MLGSNPNVRMTGRKRGRAFVVIDRRGMCTMPQQDFVSLCLLHGFAGISIASLFTFAIFFAYSSGRRSPIFSFWDAVWLALSNSFVFSFVFVPVGLIIGTLSLICHIIILMLFR